MQDSPITIYQSFDPKSQMFHRPVETALERIRTGRSRSMVEQIRLGKTKLKMQLPAVLFSGQFSYRNRESLIKHSGFICLDFDKFPDWDTLVTWRDTIQSSEFTFAIWLSPGGQGLKVLVKIPSEPENHRHYFDALKDYFDCHYFDKSVSDICRICFESYDPELYFNPSSLIWNTKKRYEQAVDPTGNGLEINETVRRLLMWSDRKFPITEGSRNANLFRLSAAFNDFGIPRPEAERILSRFASETFQTSEIYKVIRSAYRRTEKHGRYKF